MSVGAVPRTIEWIGGMEGHVVMIDRARLPTELVMLECRDVQTMWHAIRRLSVRGAPAIGIAANGDTANNIGTYAIAVLAKDHGVPFYVAAPSSTFDLATPDGSRIPIEECDPDEIRRGFGPLTAPPEVDCYCPAFDVTPAALIRGIITERGIIQPVTKSRIAETIGGSDPPPRVSMGKSFIGRIKGI